jgi:hypothetical protein
MDYVSQTLVFLLGIVGTFFKGVKESAPGQPLRRHGLPILTTAGMILVVLLGASYAVAIVSSVRGARESARIAAVQEANARSVQHQLERSNASLNAMSAQLAKYSHASDETVVMADANGWTDSGLTIRAGQTIRLNATGEWTTWPGHTDVRQMVGPNGYEDDRLIAERSGWNYDTFRSRLQLPSAVSGALIGRIGGHIFYVGPSLRIRSSEAGVLEFRCNDIDENNIGAMRVAIHIN